MASGDSDQDVEDALSKLLQMGTVAEYRNDFEMLINRVTGISCWSEEVIGGEKIVWWWTSSSLDMLTNSYLGGIIVSLIFLEGLDEEALVEFMVEWCEEDEDDDKSGEDDLFN
ncbi:hypothetical protein Tco_0038371 [Tanacetum coccineum]